MNEPKIQVRLVDVERMLGELYEEALGETSAWQAAVEADTSEETTRGVILRGK